ncbi:unnamed protein product [Caenorhabditis bovis]|uniref:Peptidase S1 domain-containing protein n=1 Tax=Caenorhabditis bovis TaxID=2654633 RepID=A0A8S1EZF5_9PELO|nr:unnamed protein product [Caenorhabditis bovis]
MLFKFLIPFIIFWAAEGVKLSSKENWILKRNCGRYVPGFNSGNERGGDDTFKALYGVEMKSGQAPWVVSIAKRYKTIYGNEEYHSHGTGTLISPYHVVTAAHLVGITSNPKPNCETGEMRDAKFMHNSNDFALFVNVTCSAPGVCETLRRPDRFEPLEVSNVYIKKGYVGDGCEDRESQNDIAVFELKNPVLFSKNVWPACLPPRGYSPKMGDETSLYGYGRDPSHEGTSKEMGVLRSITSKVDDCSVDLTIKHFFCTTANNDGLSCDGDSGSGVIRENGRKKEVIGVLSAGVNCKKLFKTHQKQERNNEDLTREGDVLMSVSDFLPFFCKCCGLCA